MPLHSSEYIEPGHVVLIWDCLHVDAAGFWVTCPLQDPDMHALFKRRLDVHQL